MKLITFVDGTQPGVGLVIDAGVVNLSRVYTDAGLVAPRDVGELFAADPELQIARRSIGAQAHHVLASLKLMPPVLQPTKVLGVGMNYESFVAQIGVSRPTSLALFHKTSSALTGHQSPIVIPPITREAVPEGELAVIIGRRASRVTPQQALSFVAGYTCANDVSARDLEFKTTQWTAGKMLPTFCPLGPVVVTADSIDDTQQLGVSTYLNGREIQRGRTADMVFGVARLLSEVSRLVILEPGDVILTGTPSDLGECDPPVFLRDGDLVSVQIEGIGLLENPVIEERDHR